MADKSYVNFLEPVPMSSHRRGHWFEPITTHFFSLELRGTVQIGITT